MSGKTTEAAKCPHQVFHKKVWNWLNFYLPTLGKAVEYRGNCQGRIGFWKYSLVLCQLI
jgi:hypothetical protein